MVCDEVSGQSWGLIMPDHRRSDPVHHDGEHRQSLTGRHCRIVVGSILAYKPVWGTVPQCSW